MNADDMVEAMQSSVAQFYGQTTATILTPGITAFADDMSVSITPSSVSVACTYPREFSADDIDGSRVLQGDAFILVDRLDANLTLDPQPGMLVTVESEQYRIERAKFLRGAVRLHLSGGAAEGTASS